MFGAALQFRDFFFLSYGEGEWKAHDAWEKQAPCMEKTPRSRLKKNRRKVIAMNITDKYVADCRRAQGLIETCPL